MKKILFLCMFFAFDAKHQTSCPVYGDNANPNVKQLDVLKNRNTPGTTIDNSVTLAGILTPGNDVNRYRSNQYVSITGYVILVQPGEQETCECKSPNPQDLDIHIELAANPTDKNTQAMVVEVNRFTKANHPEFSVGNLHSLVGTRITVTGWMMFDYEHTNRAVTTNPAGTHNWRFTCWEVHPVLKISPAQAM